MGINTAAVNWSTLYASLAVDLPEGELDGISVERFEIASDSPEYLIHRLRNGARAARPGVYTRLLRNGYLWMSDTTAERDDHSDVLLQVWRADARRVLVNGLGLGMIVKAALTLPSVEHIDVVEIDERVAKLVGTHYEQSGRVAVHVADAYEQAHAWPRGVRWDVGWSDIWPDLSVDNLPGMAQLNRAYGQRCTWHRCWGRDVIVQHQRRYGW